MKPQPPSAAPFPSSTFRPGAAPVNVDQAFQQAVALHRGGQLQAAGALYQRILAQQPRHAGSLHMLGLVALASGAAADAQRLIGQAVEQQPQDAGARVNLALALAEGGDTAAALQQIEQAMALNPQLVAAPMNRVAILVKAGRSEDAVQAASALIAAGHAHPELWVNQGIALLDLQRPQEAAASFEHALRAAPQHPKALAQRAAAQLALGEIDAAIAAADQALAVHPQSALAHRVKGLAMRRQGRLAQAEPLLRAAAELQPGETQWLLDHALVLIDLHMFDAAIAQVQKALAAHPDSAPAYVAGGRALAGQGRHEDAIANYDKALALDAALDAAHFHKAASQIDLKRFTGAIESLERCHADPAIAQPIRMQVCDWSAWEGPTEALRNTAIAQKRNPFPFLALFDDPQMHLELARAHLDLLGLAQEQARSFAPRGEGRIRVGYFSADYFGHATTYLMAELFESHDRSQFEVHAFSLGPPVMDGMRRRIEQSVEHFHDVHGRADQDIAALARSLGIDIAVDLKGFTRDGRLGVFADRCAPVQVSYLGYPGTTGAPYMDYVVADRVVLPPEDQGFFTEKAVWMPHCYQVNDSGRAIAERQISRAELGLPSEGFVFCCFNNNYKIVPGTFDSWMRILQAVPDSVLWLFQDNEDAAANLRKEAALRGVEPARLVFAERLPLDEHLARHRLADLFLDTLPYNAHTTASDALWAGLPVLTLAGKAFAGRVAASLLTAVGLPELITTTPQAYEARAIHLAGHPAELSALRERLQRTVQQGSPLFDGQRFTRHLESAYRTMHARRQASQAPEAIAVAE